MSTAHHRVHRQVLEIQGCPQDQAARLQASIRHVFYTHLLSSIERGLTALSAPSRLQRIDRLEIDLGQVSLDQFEAEVISGFEGRFRDSLEVALGGSDTGEDTSASLELLACYLSSGMLPWWADRSDRNVVELALTTAVRQAPQDLRALLGSQISRRPVDSTGGMVQSDRPGRRLTAACSDACLATVVAWLLPAYVSCDANALLDLSRLVVAAAPAVPFAPRVFTRLAWEALLVESVGPHVAHHTARTFPLAVAGHLVRWSPVAPAVLLAALDDAATALAPAVSPWTIAFVASIRHQMRAADGAVLRAQQSTPRRSAHTGEADACGADLRSDGPDTGTRSGASRDTATEPDPASDRQSRVPTGEHQRAHARLDGDGQPDAREAPSVHTRIDEVPVDNAGLVILWPFLDRFFAQQELLDGRVFRNEAARHRGVGLLQYLATDIDDALDFELPLNKVLCGMPVDQAFDCGPPISDVESQECRSMLEAAIDLAPILRNMSLPGFRHAFLLRAGQLRTCNGYWLLRVARETHDVVLERFPWTFGTVRLPWMSAPLCVEWL